MATFNLDDHRIAIPIPSIHLVRDFISAADESYLSGAVDRVGNSNAVVKPDLAISVRAGGWQRVNGRRSMYWGGTMTPKGRLVPQSPPSFMTDEWPRVFQRLEALKIFSAAEPSSSGPSPPAEPLSCERVRPWRRDPSSSRWTRIPADGGHDLLGVGHRVRVLLLLGPIRALFKTAGRG
ncbi:hypothetical protein PTTG_09846 [Puccinia triticina 1-1 BBBD Race 1]|uniref:Uncharacterized protein n=1 Tax=Puccinia triticina (isolate 1-1 / race 1 (BBBD)) TaxID=630390 RepID=A0A180GXC6_PUCT1|nr:hypothetical protein PTTG_09846 [Puccinia triticina 1-1 BBBD Race 1]